MRLLNLTCNEENPPNTRQRIYMTTFYRNLCDTENLVLKWIIWNNEGEIRRYVGSLIVKRG